MLDTLKLAFTLRPYQQEALDTLDAYWHDGGGHPLVSMATATGKSLVIAWLIRDCRERYPDLRILVLTHVQELIEQNVDHLLALWPDAPVGINCAGLGRRDTEHPVLFASVQSVYRNPGAIGRRSLVLVDEAHLIPHVGDGMYRGVLSALRDLDPDLRVAGFTATPYRLDSGRLDEGEGKVFDDVVFSYGIGEGIRDGWLSPLSSKAATTQIDVSGVGKRGGEFIESELQDAADVEPLVEGACAEILASSSGRKCWLVFACGIRHGRHVREALRRRGVTAECVFGETPSDERREIITAFKAGEITCLVNVNVLTTGFNVPQVDLLAMLRPTLSTGRYVQMVGRGTRRAMGKADCLVLDFAGNVMRHGPVDSVDPKCTGVSEKTDAVRAWECPTCKELNPVAADSCKACGYEKPRPAPRVKHATIADATPVLTGQQSWMEVTQVGFAIHYKRHDPSAPPSLRVTYVCGLSPFDEYISIERQGYARARAERWWFAMGGEPPVPATVTEALGRTYELARPVEILVYRNDRWWNVSDRRVLRPDGSIVEIDRNLNTWTRGSRQAAFEAMRREPLNDSIPY
jgi:DNA repair protein RadD